MDYAILHTPELHALHVRAPYALNLRRSLHVAFSNHLALKKGSDVGFIFCRETWWGANLVFLFKCRNKHTPLGVKFFFLYFTPLKFLDALDLDQLTLSLKSSCKN